MKKSAMWRTLELNAVQGFESITLQNDIELLISLKRSAIDPCMKRSVDHAGDIKLAKSGGFLSCENPSFVFNCCDAVGVDRCLLTRDLPGIGIKCSWFHGF